MRSLLLKNHSCLSSSAAHALLIGIEARGLSSCTGEWKCPEEESRNVKVSVWWDFENCQVPAGIDALKVAPAITEAVRANGIKGPLRINAFGDVLQLSRANQETLPFTGIHFTHIPGGKNSADRFLLLDLMHWVSQNPPPAHLFLISGDGDFAGILHRLRMKNYNILLAGPGKSPDFLCSAATIMWQWPSLVKREGLSGKHFNHPPDGPHGSWYGKYKDTLDNPFSAVEQSASLQNVEIYESSLDSKVGTIPKSVVRQVTRILRLHPRGISIIDLRSELRKHNVPLGKNFYGYKAFSRLLSGMPHVQLQPLGDGKFHVCLVCSESPGPFESNAVQSTKSAVKNDEKGFAATPKLNSEDKNKARQENETPSTASFHERSTDDDSKAFHPITSKGKSVGEYVDGKSSNPTLVERHMPQPQNKLQISSPVDYSLVDKRAGGNAESYRKGSTFFSRIRSWWPFWKSNANCDNSTAPQDEVVNHFEDSNLSEPDRTFQAVGHFKELNLSERDQNGSHSGIPELFSNDSFWNDIEYFVFTSKGTLLVSQSRSREDLARKLQKHGPLALISLTEKDILQLVELLIAEKKWLEESPSQTFPFRLAQPVQKNSLMGQSHGANGLRSLFLSRTSMSNLQNSSEHDVEKHNQSIPHTRVSALATETKYTERSRDDILEDCQKLVSEILREHPEGYSVSSFRRLFVDRYGYHLDIQKLGHRKLSSVLQKMPGLKLESTYIFPSDGESSILKTEVTNASHAYAVSSSDSKLSDSAPKDDNMESPWEELGPVSDNNSDQIDPESKLSQKAKELDTSKHPYYEPTSSNYDSSEPEGDCYCLSQSEEQGKRKCN